MAIVNCKQCYRVFRQAAQGAEYCAECSIYRQQTISKVFSHLHNNPGQSIHEVAEHCGISHDEVEDYFYNGHLGTASQYIVTRCHRCQVTIHGGPTRRRFCERCTEHIEEVAELETTREEARKATEEVKVVLKSTKAKEETRPFKTPSYGFKRC